jgi:RHH-type proline utilization regulon transcriptional repressor/proline dehydrogenase/delta 1-pyrroline-5-carboxylate dehydrogenase
MRAENLQDAIDIANQVPYGLTSGLHTLDEREKKIWIEKIEAGNLYINRGITGAIVQRQPFGGCKASSVGSGSKAGGPNYLRQCVHIYQKTLPTNDSLPLNITQLILDLTDLSKLPSYDKQILKASFLSYEKTWENFKYPQDESKIVGQDNFLIYRPRNQMSLRIGSKSKIVDVLRVIAAAIIVGLKLEISQSVETDNQFCNRIENGQIKRIRMVEKPSLEIFKVAAKSITSIIHEPVLATGRYELLHYLQEIALSHDYHRYGNLGLREKEKRKPIL